MTKISDIVSNDIELYYMRYNPNFYSYILANYQPMETEWDDFVKWFCSDSQKTHNTPNKKNHRINVLKNLISDPFNEFSELEKEAFKSELYHLTE